jgi:putative lumazine-binding protein
MTSPRAVAAPTPAAVPISRADEVAIRATIDDYYLGWYDGDADRMARALHPDLAKRGWLRDGEETALVDVDTFDTMTTLSAAGRGRRADPDDRRYEIVVNDVFGDIAAAVVHGAPYVDYIHLVRTSDGWRIINALWCPGRR